MKKSDNTFTPCTRSFAWRFRCCSTVYRICASNTTSLSAPHSAPTGISRTWLANFTDCVPGLISSATYPRVLRASRQRLQRLPRPYGQHLLPNRAGRLGFYCADGSAIHKQEVVSETRVQRKLAHRHPARCAQVGRGTILPAQPAAVSSSSMMARACCSGVGIERLVDEIGDGIEYSTRQQANPNAEFAAQPRQWDNERATRRARLEARRFFIYYMGPPGFEPGTNQLCIPLRFSPPLSGSWAGLSLHPANRGACRLVSTPSP